MALLRKDIFLDSSMVEHSAVNRVVVGSSPTRGVFLSDTLDTPSGDNTRLHGQAVKTSPFHGGNTGSIPVGVTRTFYVRYRIRRHSQVVRQRSATPSSPVQIWLAPLEHNFEEKLCFFVAEEYSAMI